MIGLGRLAVLGIVQGAVGLLALPIAGRVDGAHVLALPHQELAASRGAVAHAVGIASGLGASAVDQFQLVGLDQGDEADGLPASHRLGARLAQDLVLTDLADGPPEHGRGRLGLGLLVGGDIGAARVGVLPAGRDGRGLALDIAGGRAVLELDGAAAALGLNLGHAAVEQDHQLGVEGLHLARLGGAGDVADRGPGADLGAVELVLAGDGRAAAEEVDHLRERGLALVAAHEAGEGVVGEAHGVLVAGGLWLAVPSGVTPLSQ